VPFQTGRSDIRIAHISRRESFGTSFAVAQSGYGGARTFTSRRVHPLAPARAEIDIEDIAHALAYQCRYPGHTDGFYCVAQHSALVSQLAADQDAHWGMLHDAADSVEESEHSAAPSLAPVSPAAVRGEALETHIPQAQELPCAVLSPGNRSKPECPSRTPDRIRDAPPISLWRRSRRAPVSERSPSTSRAPGDPLGVGVYSLEARAGTEVPAYLELRRMT